jgi:hypothetical protein
VGQNRPYPTITLPFKPENTLKSPIFSPKHPIFDRFSQFFSKFSGPFSFSKVGQTRAKWAKSGPKTRFFVRTLPPTHLQKWANENQKWAKMLQKLGLAHPWPKFIFQKWAKKKSPC